MAFILPDSDIAMSGAKKMREKIGGKLACHRFFLLFFSYGDSRSVRCSEAESN